MATAGYSGRPLERKLGLKPGYVVLLDRAPDGFRLDAPSTTRLPKEFDIALTFHTHRTTLERRFAQLERRVATAGMIWVCWPKKAAIRARGIDADLDEGVVRRTGLATGLVDVKIAAIDEVWSGLKFVRRLADR